MAESGNGEEQPFYYDVKKGAAVSPAVRDAARVHNDHANANPGKKNSTASPLLREAEQAGLLKPGSITIIPPTPKGVK
ncbi:MAG: hypothetical protein WAV30_00230 [Microgenomates group bacterium]